MLPLAEWIPPNVKFHQVNIFEPVREKFATKYDGSCSRIPFFLSRRVSGVARRISFYPRYSRNKFAGSNPSTSHANSGIIVVHIRFLSPAVKNGDPSLVIKCAMNFLSKYFW